MYNSGHNCRMGKKLTGVRIKERDLEELERLAKEDDETVSFLIRQAIREFLDRRRKTTK
jgi:predicted transcriptional regulator